MIVKHKDDIEFSLKENIYYVNLCNNEVYYVLRQIGKGISMGEWTETYEMYHVPSNKNIIYIMFIGNNFKEL